MRPSVRSGTTPSAEAASACTASSAFGITKTGFFMRAFMDLSPYWSHRP